MESTIDLLSGKLLSYGISGFALIMIGLTYFLMKSELNREAPRSIAIKTIWMFMGLVILSTAVVGIFSLPLANKNDALKHEVDTLTVDMAQLTGLLSNYEYALNELATKLEQQAQARSNTNDTGATPPTKPPVKPGNGATWNKGLVLDRAVVSRHLDLSKLKVPESSAHLQLNDSTRKAVMKAARSKIDRRYYIKQ